MLPAELRLKINEARSKYWTNQKYIYTPIFKTVYRIRHGSEKPPKIGFIMTVKVGKATVRNRLKRVISEAIFKEIENLPRGLEAIIIGKQGAKGISNEEISYWTNKILPKIQTNT